jgi:hypothetical protein
VKRANLFLLSILAAISSWAADTPKQVASGAAEAKESAAKNQEPEGFAALSGKELIAKLQEKATRSRAYYELWRRANAKEDRGYAELVDTHYDLEVVTCPQGKGRDPIYLVLHGFYSRANEYFPDDFYKIENPDTLFGLLPESQSRKDGEEPAIDAFTAEGEQIDPFGGNNVLDGTLADVNGDGFMERVETTRYGGEGFGPAEVLQVSVVKSKAEPLLDVVIDWGRRWQWTYRIRKGAGGVGEIAIGPRTKDGFKAKAVYRWNAGKGAFVGPEGGAGDHFRRLKPGNTWEQLKALNAGGLTFPADPDFAEEKVAVLDASDFKTIDPPPAKPYRRHLLATWSDADLIRRMSRGRSAFDFEQTLIAPDTVPEDLWQTDPKAAALALVKANSSKKRAAGYQDIVDDRDGARPPEAGTLSVSVSSSRCYNAVDAYYFLRIDPEDSYLAYARTWAGGAVFYNFVFDQPAFDLRSCKLSYDDARRLAAVVWWLDRVRSRASGGSAEISGMSSTADGTGTVILRDAAGKVLIERTAILWSGPLSERLTEVYGHEAFVNFATYLVQNPLVARLGKAWTEAEPRHDQSNINRQQHGPIYSDEEIRHFTDEATRFLGWFSPAQDRISFAIASCAAQAAGTLVMTGAKPLLEKIEAEIPMDPVKRRTFGEVQEEREQILRSAPSKDPVEQEARKKKLEDLDAEERAISITWDPLGPAYLRTSTVLALRQIASANDPTALYNWAISDESGCQWAFQRLSQIDKARYVQVLEWWMQKLPAEYIVQVFDELSRVAPDRAIEVAEKLPPERKNALSVPAFTLLQQAGKLADEKERLAALLAVLQDPKSGWKPRSDAIDLLVPPAEPLKYPQQEIDAALLRALDADQSDGLVNFTRAAACRALALRQRKETFDRMEEVLASTGDGMLYSRILGALVLLAQSDPERFNPRLLAILAPQLKETNKQMTELLWAIWAADFRTLKPELEELATSGPEDYEDRKGSSSGSRVTPVTGKFHHARRIVDVWSNRDALTRLRLLATLMLTDTYSFVSEDAAPERVRRMRTELAGAARGLFDGDRKRLEEFLEALVSATSKDPNFPNKEAREEVVKFVRSVLKEG